MNSELIYFSSEKINEDLPACEKQLSTLFIQLGINSPARTQLSDNDDILGSAVKNSVINNDIVFICGDTEIIKSAICDAFKLKAEINEEYKSFLERLNIPVSENKALFPSGSTVVFCRQTADCAFCLNVSGKTVFSLPSVPASLTEVTDELIIPYFANKKGLHLSRTTVKLFGADETEISGALALIKESFPIRTFMNSHCGNITLEISACSKSNDESDNACYGAISALRNRFAECMYEIGSRSLAEITVELLKRNGFKISTAESCTGGMLSEAITSVSGSSGVLEMGVCAYSNRIKNTMVGVDENIISTYGAVSKETAAALAKGIKNLSGADIGVGITGVAGPGKSEGKAVGTVYISLYDGKNFLIRHLSLPETADRESIREHATFTALNLVRRYITVLPETLPDSLSEESLNIFVPTPEASADEVIPPATEEKKADNTEKPKASVYFDDSEKAAVIIPEGDNGDDEIEAPRGDAANFADFIHDDYGEGKNSDDDSPEIAAEGYYAESGLILQDDEDETPFKKKKSGSKASTGIKIAFTSVIAVLLVLAIIFGNYFFKIYRDLSQIDDARAIVSTLPTEEAFKRLYEQNNDFKGWISIGDTKVDNPVYQSTDNSYYATNNMNRQKSRYGALFFDYRNVVDGDGRSSNITVYGQNMNDGAMFGSLNSFQDLAFLKSHSEIVLTTAQGKEFYKVYAVIITNASKDQDDGHFFDFARSAFNSEEAFSSWADELKAKNLYITDLQINYGDSVLTLVTTSKAFENARLVVVAKKAESGDSAATYAVNPSPVYPKAWYEERNLEPNNSSAATDGTVTDDTSHGESSSDAASSDESSSDESSSAPSSSSPNSSRPTPSQNQSSNQSSSQPETSEPETSEPETSEPETSEPETSEPEASEPQSSNTENSEPNEGGDA